MATETTQRTDERNLANAKLRYMLLVMPKWSELGAVLSIQSAYTQYSAFQG